MEGCYINKKIKVGIVALMAILSVMLLALVAPKTKAYDESYFIAQGGQSPTTIKNNAVTALTDAYSGITLTDYYLVNVYNYGSYVAYRTYFFESSNIELPYTRDNGNEIYGNTRYCFYEYRSNGGIGRSNWQNARFSVYKDTFDYPNFRNVFSTVSMDLSGSVDISPTKIFNDEFYIGAQGWNIQYTVQAGAESLDNGWWHSTKNYVLKCAATLNGQPAVVTIPNYPGWYMQVKLVNIKPVGELIELPTAKPQPYMNIQAYFHAVSYYPGVLLNPSQDALYTPDVSFTDQWKDAPEDMTSIHISQLHKLFYAIDNTIPNDFLKQNITFTWVGADDNRVYYTKTLNYSQADWGLITPADTESTDWTDTISNIINDINRYNNYELMHNPPLGWDKPVFGQLETLTDFTAPDIVYTLPSVDPDAQGFFAWIVSFFFNSPMGIVFSTILLFFILSHLLNN